MLCKQSRQMTLPEAEALGQRVHTTSVQRSHFDKLQRTLDGRSCAFPRGAEWSRLGAAAQTGTVTGAFRRCRARIERDVHNPVKSGVAPLKSFILSDTPACGPCIPHAGTYQSAAMITSENDRFP